MELPRHRADAVIGTSRRWRGTSTPSRRRSNGDTASHDRILHVLDRDGRINQASKTSTFARRRADATRKLREIIRLVQPIERVPPLVLVDQRVEFGNQVVDGTSSMSLAERSPAVHAPRCLHDAFHGVVALTIDLLPVRDALHGRSVRFRIPLVVDEASDITNDLDGAVSPLDLGQGVVVVVSPPSLVVLRGLGREGARRSDPRGGGTPACTAAGCAARHALAGAAQHRSSFWRSMKATQVRLRALGVRRRCGAGVFSQIAAPLWPIVRYCYQRAPGGCLHGGRKAGPLETKAARNAANGSNNQFGSISHH